MFHDLWLSLKEHAALAAASIVGLLALLKPAALLRLMLQGWRHFREVYRDASAQRRQEVLNAQYTQIFERIDQELARRDAEILRLDEQHEECRGELKKLKNQLAIIHNNCPHCPNTQMDIVE